MDASKNQPDNAKTNLEVTDMSFQSILFDKPQNYIEPAAREEPYFFHDLNLDQLFKAITKDREEYNLLTFFSMPLNDIEGIKYRHDVQRDLEGKTLYNHLFLFAEDLKEMRQQLVEAGKLSYEYQKMGWFLDAVETYCDAVLRLEQQLSTDIIKSNGFLAFREYLASYANSEAFKSLVSETKKLKKDLASVAYCIHINGRRITVTKYTGEPDYSDDVLGTFEKFRQGSAKSYRVKFYTMESMDFVEEKILGLVARLYPEIFLPLSDYYNRNQKYLDLTIGRFDREIQFYTAYMDFIGKLKAYDLSFCYPEVTGQSKEVNAYATFDLALANKIINERSVGTETTANYYHVPSELLPQPKVVTNDFYLKNPERIFVVSGPNQGGKTTFARLFGQLHYLAKLGYPVPGKKATLFLFDHLFTHFEKEERIENLRGKLQDELVRIHAILQDSTGNSIIIVNESFTSAMLKDAIFLGKEVLKQIMQLDALCVYVTFIDELSTLSEKTVSMVSTIVPENPALRTYKIVRKPADGLAYAIAIAQKYGLTQEVLERRIAK